MAKGEKNFKRGRTKGKKRWYAQATVFSNPKPVPVKRRCTSCKTENVKSLIYCWGCGLYYCRDCMYRLATPLCKPCRELHRKLGFDRG